MAILGYASFSDPLGAHPLHAKRSYSMDIRDLQNVAPRSPNDLLGEHVILARTIDKCRADLVGMAGDYHWNCRLAKILFDFKGIAPDMFRARIAEGLTDNEIQAWIDTTGTLRTEDEILAWSYDCRWNAPATTELKAFIERNAREISPNYLYIRSLFELIYIEEGYLTLPPR